MSEKMYKDGEYLEKNPSWHIEDSPWKVNHIMKIMKDNNIQPRSICDVGCGAGEILHQLYIQMPGTVSFLGYELSPQAFELCQQREQDRLHFYLKNLVEDEKAFFDVILAIDVIEHVEDYWDFLKKMQKKGEYKIFHIPLDLSVQTVLRSSRILKERKMFGHIHYFTKETALATLEDTGYKILDYFYTASSIDLSVKSTLSLLARLPRKMLFKINKDMTVRLLGGYSLLVLTK